MEALPPASDITDAQQWQQERAQLLARNAELLTLSNSHMEAARAQAQQVQQALAAAEQARRSKDEFLSMVSHELRTPLSAILGWAHVLERGAADAETSRVGVMAIARNARAQARLIDDLIDMNHLEHDALRLQSQRIELRAVVAAAVDAALPAATAKGVGLRTALGALPGSVMGDAARLQQLVARLLDNAIKFTPEHGQIGVTLDDHEGAVRLRVADSGQGIEPAFVQRLFERFEQQDAGSTRRHGGLGIGLSIVRRVVELQGGSVHALSDGPGQGATFCVELPAAPALPALPVAEASPPPQAEPRLDGVKVLLVDDAPDARAVWQQVLRDAGAQVVLAAGADEALRLLAEHHPTVLLSDIGLPLTDGYELIRRVRALARASGGDTPAAAFTAYSQHEDRKRALASGFQMHLTKPLAPVALVRALARLALMAKTAQPALPGTPIA